MMADPGDSSVGVHQTRLVDLQRQRMQYDELGVQLEGLLAGVSEFERAR